jgi:hypothetical protein
VCAALSYPNPSSSQEILAALAAPAADAAAVAAQCRYDDAAAEYKAAAAEYKANADEKRDIKLKELKDEAFANLQSANEYLALTFRNIPDAVMSSSRKRESEEDPERCVVFSLAFRNPAHAFASSSTLRFLARDLRPRRPQQRELLVQRWKQGGNRRATRRQNATGAAGSSTAHLCARVLHGYL